MLQKGKRKIKKKGRQAGKKEPFLSSFSFKSISGRICWQPCQLLRVGSRLQWGNQISVPPEIFKLWLHLKEDRQQPTRQPPHFLQSSEKQLGPVSQALTTLPTPSAYRNFLEKGVSAPPLLPCNQNLARAFTGVLSRLRESVPGTERGWRRTGILPSCTIL